MEAQGVVPLPREGTTPSTCPIDALTCPPRASQPPTSRGSDFCVHLEPGLQHLLSVQRERTPLPLWVGLGELVPRGALSGRYLGSSCFTRPYHPLVFSGATLSSWVVCQLA